MQSNGSPDAKSHIHEILINDFYDKDRFYTIQNHKEGEWSWREAGKSNHDMVLGFGALFTRDGQSQLAAYFSESREDANHAPNYSASLWFFFEPQLFDLQSADVTVEFNSGIVDRIFTIARTTSRDQISCQHRYRWPFYRQLSTRLFGDPFNYVSQDFFWEFKQLLKVYRPERLIG